MLTDLSKVLDTPSTMSSPFPDPNSDNGNSEFGSSGDGDPLTPQSIVSPNEKQQGELFETAPPPWELAAQDDVALALSLIHI